MITQRQTPTQCETTDKDGCWEHATCPFCNHETYRTYLGPIGNEYIQVVDYCNHFMGFVAGSRGLPTSMYQGFHKDLEVVE